jgi:hypothetical protein
MNQSRQARRPKATISQLGRKIDVLNVMIRRTRRPGSNSSIADKRACGIPLISDAFCVATSSKKKIDILHFNYAYLSVK